MAASIAYFSFFSLFPLLLGIVAAGSYFVDLDVLRERLEPLIVDTLPGSGALVRDNVDALFRLRGVAGLASVLGLFWSASKMAGAVSRGINRALDADRRHPAYLSPLRNFLMDNGGFLASLSRRQCLDRARAHRPARSHRARQPATHPARWTCHELRPRLVSFSCFSIDSYRTKERHGVRPCGRR